MPAFVISSGDALPATGKFGDMYFNVATSETHMWSSGKWVLAVSGSDTTLPARSSDPVAAAAEQRAEDYRSHDANSRHGKVILGAVFEDHLRGHLKRVSTRNASANVEFRDGTPLIVEGADHYNISLYREALGLHPGAFSFPLRYGVLRCLLVDNDDGQHLDLEDLSWRLVTALSDGGPERVGQLLDRWHEYWLKNDVRKRAEAEAAEVEAREIFRQALLRGSAGHGEFTGDAVS